MLRLAGVLAAAALLFAAGIAVSAFGARNDAPLKSQTYTDPIGDAPQMVPDLGDTVVSDFADGTLQFQIALPEEPVLAQYQNVGVLIDNDGNPATGQNGFDYLVSAAGAGLSAPSFELSLWTGTAWMVLDSIPGNFVSQGTLTLSVPESRLHITKGFDFIVRGVYAYGQTYLKDDAPSDGSHFTYVLGSAATTSTATTTTAATTTTTSTVPKKKPLPKCKKGQRSTKKKPCRR